MDVLVEVILELLKESVRELQAPAGVRGRRVVIRQLTDLFLTLPFFLVFRFHDTDRGFNGAAVESLHGVVVQVTVAELIDEGVKHHLFLHQVVRQIHHGLLEERLDFVEFGVIRAVHFELHEIQSLFASRSRIFGPTWRMPR